MECKREISQRFEVRVRVGGGSVTHHDRLRFALLTNWWVPKPAGMLLWSALHVLLIVGRVALEVSLNLCAFAFNGPILDIFQFAAFALHLIVGGPVLFICSLLRLSWALMRERERARQIRVACGSFVKWWKSMLTPREIGLDDDTLWYLCTPMWTWFAFDYDLRNAVKDPVLCNELRSWCEEVMHVHDAIRI